MHMLVCMKRTTLVLEEACMQKVRQLAHEQKRQISQVVNELILESLIRRKKRSRAPVSLASFKMGKPPVHLGDRNALEALMDS
jgi:hypothetical protein